MLDVCRSVTIIALPQFESSVTLGLSKDDWLLLRIEIPVLLVQVNLIAACASDYRC